MRRCRVVLNCFFKCAANAVKENNFCDPRDPDKPVFIPPDEDRVFGGRYRPESEDGTIARERWSARDIGSRVDLHCHWRTESLSAARALAFKKSRIRMLFLP